MASSLTRASAAQAFIEVYVAGACADALQEASPALAGVLERVLRLDALCRVRAQMAWYLTEGLVTAAQAQQVRDALLAS